MCAGPVLRHQREMVRYKIPNVDLHIRRKPVVEATPVEKSIGWARSDLPKGMVRIPETTFEMHVEHRRRECGYYHVAGNVWEWTEVLSLSMRPRYVSLHFSDPVHTHGIAMQHCRCGFA